jgi:hypothetical protein
MHGATYIKIRVVFYSAVCTFLSVYLVKYSILLVHGVGSNAFIWFNCLKYSGSYMYHFCNLKKLYFFHNVYLRVSYNSRSTYRLALRYCSGGLGIDPQWYQGIFFPRLPTEPCSLGSTQPLNMSTRKIPGSEAGRCVRLTTS